MTKNLASELLNLVDGHEKKAAQWVLKYVRKYPNKSTNWHFEQAIIALTKIKYSN